MITYEKSRADSGTIKKLISFSYLVYSLLYYTTHITCPRKIILHVDLLLSQGTTCAPYTYMYIYDVRMNTVLDAHEYV